jgi:phosphoribosylformylglycinamidine synthase
MGDACRALDYPIVSGNVSLYNESKATGGSAILPTPAIGGVGLMLNHEKMATVKFKAPGDIVWLIGPEGSTLASRCGCARSTGLRKAPPRRRSGAELRNGETVRQLIGDGVATAVHDVSDGGLLVALAEMAMAGGLA